MDTYAGHLVFHGAIVLIVGLLCGAPYGRAILRNAPAHVIHSWRVAHGALPIGSGLMFAIAAVLSGLKASVSLKWTIAACLIASGYAFCMSLPLAAVAGHRGLSARGPAVAKVVYTGNVIGSLTSLVAAVALACAAYISL